MVRVRCTTCDCTKTRGEREERWDHTTAILATIYKIASYNWEGSASTCRFPFKNGTRYGAYGTICFCQAIALACNCIPEMFRNTWHSRRGYRCTTSRKLELINMLTSNLGKYTAKWGCVISLKIRVVNHICHHCRNTLKHRFRVVHGSFEQEERKWRRHALTQWAKWGQRETVDSPVQAVGFSLSIKVRATVGSHFFISTILPPLTKQLKKMWWQAVTWNNGTQQIIQWGRLEGSIIFPT